MDRLFQKPKIILPIMSGGNLKVINRLKPDIVEVRLDYFEKNIFENLKKIRKKINKTPIIATYRTKSQGGRASDDQENYKVIVEKIIKNNLADIIDLEYGKKILNRDNIQKVHGKNIKVIGSYHELDSKYDERVVEKIVESLEEMRVDIVKIALNLKREEDVNKFLSFSFRKKKENKEKEFIFISMGDLGKITRIYNTDYSFAHVGQKSGHGQIEYSDMKKILNIIYD